MAPCALSDAIVMAPEMMDNQDGGELASQVREVTDVAEVVAGYLDCMQEAVRYLVEVERYPECHPAVLGLRQHLALYQSQLVCQALVAKA